LEFTSAAKPIVYMRKIEKKNEKKIENKIEFFVHMLPKVFEFPKILTRLESPRRSASIDTHIAAANIDGGGATSGQMSIFTIFRR
jgi:imidazoleglycerol phosphate dehydratase HisB